MNSQNNSGAIIARVVDAVPGVAAGLYASNVTVGANIVSAIAIGNQAVNTISTR